LNSLVRSIRFSRSSRPLSGRIAAVCGEEVL
jgi:hypothetical protein